MFGATAGKSDMVQWNMSMGAGPKCKKKKKSKQNKRRSGRGQCGKKHDPVFINQMVQNQVHSGKELLCRTVTKPFKMSSIMMIVEDDFGTVVLLAVYNDSSPVQKYRIGTKLCIRSPFYKIGSDGKPMVRVDDVSTVQIVSDEMSIGAQERSALEWKVLANRCFGDNNFKYAVQCYSRGIDCFDDAENGDVVISLLNNRAVCFMKMGQCRMAFINLIASKYINSTVFKTWYREMLCLNQMGHHEQAFAVWQRANELFPGNKQSLNRIEEECHFKSKSVDGAKNKKMIIDPEWDLLDVIVDDMFSMKLEDDAKEEQNEKTLKTASDLKESGNIVFRAGHYEEAIRHYDLCLKVHYNLLSILFANRCAASIHCNEHKVAFQDSTLSIVLNPENIKGWFRRCATAKSLGIPRVSDAICAHFANNQLFTRLTQKFRLDLIRKMKNNTENKRSNDEHRGMNQEEKMDVMMKRDTMTTDQLSVMNAMMNMLPVDMQKQMNIQSDISDFHNIFAQQKRYPLGVDVRKCDEILRSAYEHARGMGMHQFALLREEYEPKPKDIVKRLGTNDKDVLKWYFTAKQEDYIRIHESTFRHFEKTGSYDKTMFHSFSNAVDHHIIMQSGHSHIAIGFCDLGLLANCSINQSDADGPVHFMGIDMSSYSVAKSYVINEMLKNKEMSSESVLEVWFSSTWTKPTKCDFQNILETIVNTQHAKVRSIGKRVHRHIQHWYKSKGVTVRRARKLWFEGITETHSHIATFNAMEDILEFAEYVVSGDVTRANTKSVCGNITMFDNIEHCPKRAKNESIYNVLQMDKRFANKWKEAGSMKKTASLILLEGIQKMKKWILTGNLVIDFMNETVSPENVSLIQKLSAMKPWSVSWSNCIDYVHPIKFHRMAKEIGSEDCVHFAYTMNYIHSVKGSHIMDYPDAKVRSELLNASSECIKMMWGMTGLLDLYRFPPIDNPLNVGSVGPIMKTQKEWVRWFLCRKIAKCPVHYNADSVLPVFYAPTHRANTIVHFAWTYDQELRLTHEWTV